MLRQLTLLFLVAASAGLGFANNTSAQMVQYRSEVTDASGNPTSSIDVGDAFMFHVYVKDIQADPMGVFAAFVDVLYDAKLFGTTGPIEHSKTYESADSGDLTIPGLMDEVGGVDGLKPLFGDEYLVFSVPMTSLGSMGTGQFTMNIADDLVQHPTIVFGSNTPLGESDILFIGTSLTVVPEPASASLLLLAAVVFYRRLLSAD